MKVFSMVTMAILLALYVPAQVQPLDTRKYIDVTGSAHMQLAPDELDLEIQLQEYDRSGKKIKLDEITLEFYSRLKKNLIDTSQLIFIGSSDYYWWYWWNQRDKYYQTRMLTIKLNKSTDILKLIEDLNEKWVQSIRIAKSSHSKIYEYRKEVKKEAIKMAKEKAKYLLETLGEELGNVLSIEELPERNGYSWYGGNMLENTAFNARVEGDDGSNAVNGVKAIKLQYEVKVKFAIK